MSISPASAVSAINAVTSQLRLAGVTPAREAQLEQQLVQTISGANPSANWAMIATITNDIADPTVSAAAAAVDVSALDRMVVPTTAATLSAALGSIAQQLRGQSPLPAGVTSLSAQSSAGATAVTLPSTTGMVNGDAVRIQLDDGATFSTTIATILGNIVNLAKPLPAQASSGKTFVDAALQKRAAASGSGNASNAIVTNLTAGALLNASVVKVKSAAGMVSGDAVQLQLSDGSTLDTTITGITGSTTLAADALGNANSVTVGSAAGMANGDTVQILLDNGTVFSTIIASIAGNTVNLAAPLPSQASTGVQFTDPSNILVSLAAPLPVSASAGGSLVDTQNVPASAAPIASVSNLTAATAGGVSTLTLTASGGMANGDAVQIQLTNGAVFNTTIANITGNTVTIAAPLPSGASLNATVTDLVSPVVAGSTFTPAVALSPEMQTMLQLQLQVLIGTANPNADVQTLQTTVASLIGSTLTSTQFQQDLNALVALATGGPTTGTSLSIVA
jgi:hypothetical protein